jgi:hypothetical protein
MKQAVFSLLAAVLFTTTLIAPAHAAQPLAQQTSPPVLCVIDGCNDPYPGPQR